MLGVRDAAGEAAEREARDSAARATVERTEVGAAEAILEAAPRPPAEPGISGPDAERFFEEGL
jgi:hypothetical protein